MIHIHTTQDTPVHGAVTLLMNRDRFTHDEYTQVLDDVLKTGYDINSNASELFITAIYQRDVARVKTLLARGASVASDKYVHNGIRLGHAFNGGWVHCKDMADILLDHVLSNKHFDIIKAFLDIDSWDRMDVFNNASSDTARAELYIRVRRLPKKRPNDEIMKLCESAGLTYVVKPTIIETLQRKVIELERTLEETKEDNERLRQDLAIESDRYTKALVIITKLTAI